MPTIAFLDLDNTFWTETGVPDSALEAIKLAQANGHLVFSNTGRARAGTRDLVPYGLDGRCYAAGAEAFLGDEKIVDEPLGVETSRMLCSLLDVGEGILIAEGGDRCYIRVYDEPMFQQLFEILARIDDPFIDHPEISTMTDEDHAQIFKYSLWIDGGVPAAVKESIPAGFRETTMGDATEFTQVGHTKATALEMVRRAMEQQATRETTSPCCVLPMWAFAWATGPTQPRRQPTGLPRASMTTVSSAPSSTSASSRVKLASASSGLGGPFEADIRGPHLLMSAYSGLNLQSEADCRGRVRVDVCIIRHHRPIE